MQRSGASCLSRYLNVFAIVSFNSNRAQAPLRERCLMYLVPEEDPESCRGIH